MIDEIAPRHTALLKNDRVTVNIKGKTDIEETKDMPKHPKNSKLGSKPVWYGTKIMIDQADALTVKENDIVTFMVLAVFNYLFSNSIINVFICRNGEI